MQTLALSQVNGCGAIAGGASVLLPVVVRAISSVRYTWQWITGRKHPWGAMKRSGRWGRA